MAQNLLIFDFSCYEICQGFEALDDDFLFLVDIKLSIFEEIGKEIGNFKDYISRGSFLAVFYLGSEEILELAVDIFAEKS